VSAELRAGERDSAIGAAEGTCPRCGAGREPDQRYCLECGLALPEVSGTVAALRRRWVRRFGWYPGDWVWLALATLLIAAAGAAVAIVLAAGRPSSRHVVVALAGAVPVTAPQRVPERSTSTTRAHGKEAATAKLISWPRNEQGWTIVLVSYPEANGRPSALSAAHAAATSSLRQVGILDSSLYPSLQPGYLVVFSGIYASQPDADAGVSTARQAGFGGAYSREISR
jgi:hypothetical protein